MSRADEVIERLQARIVELEVQVAGTRLDVITQIDAHAVTRAELAALKAQPSAGIVLPEQDGSDAQISFWAGFEFAACGLHNSNIRLAWNDFKGSEQFKRLNPCRAQSVPDGYVMVPLQMTDGMRDAGNVYTLNRATLCRIWADMLAAAQSAKKEG